MLSIRNCKSPLAIILLMSSALSLCAQMPERQVRYIAYGEAQPILKLMDEVLPAELRGKSEDEQSAVWPAWVRSRDQQIRARLGLGDEDSLINFMLFGTSFTRRPRITLEALSQVLQKSGASSEASPRANALIETIEARADDLVRGLSAPGTNERLLFSRTLIESKGYRLGDGGARLRVKQYLMASLERMLKEQAGYARTLEAAQLLGDASAEFAERSKLFRGRGLSSDTSLLPNFALELSLEAMKERGVIAPGSIRRVGIIGPGLDFTDKQDGYDFYPQQTIQPFAVIDTLLRLGLSRADQLQLTTFDLSPRVNDHLRRARATALGGKGYTLQLPRDPEAQWKAETVRYWERLGDRIGAPARPVAVPEALAGLKIRAVTVRPAIVLQVTPEDMNIVYQRLALPPKEGFDLIIGTNIFVYYDVLEQSLALANIENMLRQGGLLLSNNALLELPSSGMRSIGYQTAVYSDRPNDGDHIVWYQRVTSE